MSIINTLNKDTHYFTLDLHGGAILAEPLLFKQCDHNSRILAIELTVHDVSLDLTDARVDIWVYKSDGHLVQKAVDKDNIDLDNSMIIIPLTSQMLSVLPKIECEIVVTYANKSVLSFPTFFVEIEDSNIDIEEVVSTSEFNLFYDALYRMEQWMRDYLQKYNTVDQSFTQKLTEIENEKQRLIVELEELSQYLIANDEIRFEELKQATIEEFFTWFQQAKVMFAYAMKEAELRFNTLYAKCEALHTRITEIKEEAELHLAFANNMRKQIEQVKEEIDTTHANMVKLYDDAVRRFAEMENTFQADQVARQNAFDMAQSDRTNEFTKAQSQRNTDFLNAQTERENAYTVAEQNRDNSYNQREEEREERFGIAEVTRQQNETTRLSNEESRVVKENEREQQFNEMQNIFNEYFLTFRPIE